MYRLLSLGGLKTLLVDLGVESCLVEFFAALNGNKIKLITFLYLKN